MQDRFHSFVDFILQSWLLKNRVLNFYVRAKNFLRVPTHTGKLREVFPFRENSGNFKNLPKSQGNLDQKIFKNIWQSNYKSIFVKNASPYVTKMWVITEYEVHK